MVMEHLEPSSWLWPVFARPLAVYTLDWSNCHHCISIVYSSVLSNIVELSSLYVSWWSWLISHIDFPSLERSLSPLSSVSTLGVCYCLKNINGGIVLPHTMDRNCCCQKQASFSSWFLSLFLHYSYYFFFKKVFRAFQKKAVESL